MCYLIVSVLNKTQWSTLVTGRYLITMMMLLCYVNLSGMSLEGIVIVLMNNSLLGGQECTDYVDVQQNGHNSIRRGMTAIIPRLNFTCNGRITIITAKVNTNYRNDYPYFQVWRPTSVGSTSYEKSGEVQLQSGNHMIICSSQHNNRCIVNITLTGTNTIEVESGDIVGFYLPSESRYRVRTIQTSGYILYEFDGSLELVNFSNMIDNEDNQQPLIQFTIGKCLDELFTAISNVT